MNRFGKIIKSKSELKKWTDKGWLWKEFKGKILVYKERPIVSTETGHS